jgi:NAD-dependent deacetylase sirtuin 2
MSFPDLEELKKELFDILPLSSPDLYGIKEYIEIVKPNKIIVLSGAGISTKAGIPDFRSKGTGLYDNLQKFKDLPYPEAIFDIEYFYENPLPFYTLAKEMINPKFKPTTTHYFIKLLSQKGILLKNFTQNVDVLERKAGLDPDKIVEAHGSFHDGKCVGRSPSTSKCDKVYSQEWMKDQLLHQDVLKCTDCGGHVKPNITFFGEALPERFYDSLGDFSCCDLLIVLGTSLSVAPFASLPGLVSADTPRLLINMELVGDFCIDLQPENLLSNQSQQESLINDENSQDSSEKEIIKSRYRDACFLGDVQDGIKELVKLLGWEEELKEISLL